VTLCNRNPARHVTVRDTAASDRETATVLRGLVFYRVLELAVGHDPVRYRDLVADPKHKAKPPTPPAQQGQPPGIERPRAARPWRTAYLA